jgi:membrane protein YqaA with SNARE-associated domain
LLLSIPVVAGGIGCFLTVQLGSVIPALIETMRLPAIVVLISKKGALRWLIHLGGPGLILLGLADNSLVPLPGSMDVFTILLSAHHRSLWVYYAAMATVGAVLGGYLTYRMARRGGKATLEKKFSKKKAEKVYATFSRWGFAAVAIPALLPPPFPIVPMLLAAGALQYPTKKFLSALTVGRGVRFAIVGFLGAHYGRGIMRFLERYYSPVLIVLIALAVLGGLYGLCEYLRKRKSGGRRKNTRVESHPRRHAA